MVFDQKIGQFLTYDLLHHLKELNLSFQNNLKTLWLDTQNWSYGRSKIPTFTSVYM